ncbi:MAG: hypothetical protein HC869_06120 [Rhodospirillales bacterium]|nr:hypothetical protein [Rhodospirillales bacterium]
MALIEEVRARIACEPPRAEGVLALRGVLEVAQPADDAREAAARDRALLKDLERVFASLMRTRQAEGGKLRTVILGPDGLAEGGAIAA